jgi:DNA-binding beta-propeller fold protein YncE
VLFSVAALLTTCSSPGAAPATNSSLLAPNRFAGSQRQAKGVVGSLYISSQLKHAVAVYGGNPLDYAGSIKKGLSLPNAIAFNSNKELFVADQGTNAVSVYAASTGKLIRTLSTRFTKTPTQVAVAPNGDVYVRSRNYVYKRPAVGEQKNQRKTLHDLDRLFR